LINSVQFGLQVVCLFWNDRIGAERGKKNFFFFVFSFFLSPPGSHFYIYLSFFYLVREISAKILNQMQNRSKNFNFLLQLFSSSSFVFLSKLENFLSSR